MLEKQEKRYRRHRRVRAKIFGTAKVPRLCVFRSAKHIYVQLIDDEKKKTLASASDLPLTFLKFNSENTKNTKNTIKKVRGKKTVLAVEVGKLIAKKAIAKKITKVVFDRGGYKYHGRVKALAEGAREGGLEF